MTYNVSSFQNVNVFTRNVSILGKIMIFIVKIMVFNCEKTLNDVSDLQTLVTFEHH